MKVKNPKSRFHLNIKPTDYVLEVGGGHNPHPRANVVVDKYSDSNFHRSGDIKVLKNQMFMEADGENLPFKDKEFDYVICCHVLEHVDNPVKFLSEQFRVAKRGYIEIPSSLGEYLVPKRSHKWMLQEVKDTLYLVEKDKVNFNVNYDMGELILDYLPTHSIGFKIMERTHPNLLTVRIEWENDFEFEVNPNDPAILNFFKGQWNKEAADLFFPEKSIWKEILDTSEAFLDITKSVIKSKILKLNK